MQNADWGDRRHPCRREAETGDAGFWMPDRAEIVTRFFTRQLFFSLAVIYFATLKAVSPALFCIEYLLMRARRLFSPQPLFFIRRCRRRQPPLSKALSPLSVVPRKAPGNTGWHCGRGALAPNFAPMQSHGFGPGAALPQQHTPVGGVFIKGGRHDSNDQQ